MPSDSTLSSRSFTVFVDIPASEAPEKKIAPSSAPPSPLLSSSTTLLLPVTTTEKENLDPLTGERAGTITTNGKKRKGSISVLATKAYPAESKSLKEKDGQKGKDVIEAQPEAKKRKSSISSSSSSASKPKVKKGSKTSGSGKKPLKRSSRRTSPMPKVDEENELENQQTGLSQAEINSRCYDFTVKPLADVSEAYEAESTFSESPAEEEDRFFFVKAASAEPEIRDYFPENSLSTSTLRGSSRGSSPAEMRKFSTPERKQIYSSFTFTSPSPTSQRLAKLTRSYSMPALDLGV